MSGTNPKRLVMDVDETVCFTVAGDYHASLPNLPVIEKLRWYKAQGFDVVFYSARNMRTFEGSIGRICAVTLPILIDWLRRHDVPFDEIIMGKPWCGTEGFYVDDKAIRPDEFVRLSAAEIRRLVAGGSQPAP